jgi:hypothetical protein
LMTMRRFGPVFTASRSTRRIATRRDSGATAAQ